MVGLQYQECVDITSLRRVIAEQTHAEQQQKERREAVLQQQEFDFGIATKYRELTFKQEEQRRVREFLQSREEAISANVHASIKRKFDAAQLQYMETREFGLQELHFVASRAGVSYLVTKSLEILTLLLEMQLEEMPLTLAHPYTPNTEIIADPNDHEIKYSQDQLQVLSHQLLLQLVSAKSSNETLIDDILQL